MNLIKTKSRQYGKPEQIFYYDLKVMEIMMDRNAYFIEANSWLGEIESEFKPKLLKYMSIGEHSRLQVIEPEEYMEHVVREVFHTWRKIAKYDIDNQNRYVSLIPTRAANARHAFCEVFNITYKDFEYFYQKYIVTDICPACGYFRSPELQNGG